MALDDEVLDDDDDVELVDFVPESDEEDDDDDEDEAGVAGVEPPSDAAAPALALPSDLLSVR